MSPSVLSAMSALAAAGEGESHFPPKAEDFWLPLFSVGGFSFTRPMLICTIVTIGLAIWLMRSASKARLVPSKGQWLTEQIYDMVRNGLGRDMIGHGFRPYVPFLFSLFVFILFNNWAGIIPPLQLPTMSRIGFPIGLVLVVYIVYHVIGFRKMGFAGYFKHMIPEGVPGWIAPVILVLEIITYFITRPLTLALRLFGNMFAGHMLLVVFIVGGYELMMNDSIGLKAVALPAFLMGFVMTLFEALVQFLQAYVFTLLTASYIGGALADDH